MPVGWDLDDYMELCKRMRARFDAKVAKLRAKGVQVIPGSALEGRLKEAARRG